MKQNEHCQRPEHDLQEVARVRAVAQTVGNRLHEDPVSTCGSVLMVPRLANRAAHLAKLRFILIAYYSEVIACRRKRMPCYDQRHPTINLKSALNFSSMSLVPGSLFSDPSHLGSSHKFYAHVQVPAVKSWLSATLHTAISQLKVLSDSVYMLLFVYLSILDFYIYRAICMHSHLVFLITYQEDAFEVFVFKYRGSSMSDLVTIFHPPFANRSMEHLFLFDIGM